MIKRIFYTTLLGILCFGNTFAQVQKYPLFEHFTNSKCPVCALKNPKFKSEISGKTGYNLISYHTKFPYSDCIFYQANKPENEARTVYYAVTGVSDVYVNGRKEGIDISADRVNTLLNETSPLQINVKESGQTSRHVEVEYIIKGNIPAGDYKLYVAIVEGKVLRTTPNGETEHWGVFRKMLPDIEGLFTDLAGGAIGSSGKVILNYEVSGEWNTEETYAIAFIQNTATGEVLNSGSVKTTTVGTKEEAEADINVYPNPAISTLNISTAADIISYRILSAGGQSFTGGKWQNQPLDLGALPSGHYNVELTDNKGVKHIRSFVKL